MTYVLDLVNTKVLDWGMMSNTAALQRAISIAGSEAKLGAVSGYSQAAIAKAKKRGRVSAEMALAIDWSLDGAVSASEIRADLWANRRDVPPKPPIEKDIS